MLTALILAASLSQTVGVMQQTNPTKLTPAQVTAVGNHIAARWPVTVGNVLAFDCTREREACFTVPTSDPPLVQCQPTHVGCYPTASESLTSAAVWSLLRSGQAVPAGLAGGTRQRIFPARTYDGTDLTALASFVGSLWPETSGATYLSLHLQREDGGKVTAQLRYCKSVTQAEAWALVQGGASLEPCQP